jgi:hypothetical protein
MAVNKYLPHIYIIPEDDANREIAVGFELHHQIIGNALQITPVAGGWSKVCDKINEVYVPKLRSSRYAHVVGLIDSDNKTDRIAELKSSFPSDVVDRIFLLGCLSEPERLRTESGLNLERIGKALATECADENYELWHSSQLQHLQFISTPDAKALRDIVFDLS